MIYGRVNDNRICPRSTCMYEYEIYVFDASKLKYGILILGKCQEKNCKFACA